MIADKTLTDCRIEYRREITERFERIKKQYPIPKVITSSPENDLVNDFYFLILHFDDMLKISELDGQERIKWNDIFRKINERHAKFEETIERYRIALKRSLENDGLSELQ